MKTEETGYESCFLSSIGLERIECGFDATRSSKPITWPVIGA